MVRTILNGAERQNYPISDMIFSAQQLVSKISHDMTLLPGDLICCGTSVGVGVMKEPVNTVSVVDRRHRRTDQRISDVAGGTQKSIACPHTFGIGSMSGVCLVNDAG